MKRPASILGSILLMLLFLGYYGGTTLFYHVHLEPQGAVVHSHPVWGHDTNSSTHHHSRTAYQTIQQLSHILLVLFMTDVLLRIYRTDYAPLRSPQPHRLIDTSKRWTPRRAPPVR